MIPYSFRIETTTLCPYQCPYCIQSKRRATVPIPLASDKKFTFCIDWINKSNLSSFYISLDGGEPSLCDCESIFTRFLEECPDKKFTFELITNLYKSPEYYAELAKKYKLKISASFHETETTLENFKKRLVALNGIIRPNVTYVVTAENVDQAEEVYNELHDYCRLKFVKEKDGKHDIIQNEHYEEVFAKLNKLPGIIPYYDKTKIACNKRVCTGTFYQTSIRYNGDIMCSPSCNIVLGNVYNNPYKSFIDRKLMVCSAEECRMCGHNIRIMNGKEKDLCL